jgi:hypothetical protein
MKLAGKNERSPLDGALHLQRAVFVCCGNSDNTSDPAAPPQHWQRQRAAISQPAFDPIPLA